MCHVDVMECHVLSCGPVSAPAVCKALQPPCRSAVPDAPLPEERSSRAHNARPAARARTCARSGGAVPSTVDVMLCHGGTPRDLPPETPSRSSSHRARTCSGHLSLDRCSGGSGKSGHDEWETGRAILRYAAGAAAQDEGRGPLHGNVTKCHDLHARGAYPVVVSDMRPPFVSPPRLRGKAGAGGPLSIRHGLAGTRGRRAFFRPPPQAGEALVWRQAILSKPYSPASRTSFLHPVSFPFIPLSPPPACPASGTLIRAYRAGAGGCRRRRGSRT